MVYITKFALDKGILEAEILAKVNLKDSDTKESQVCYELSTAIGNYLLPVSEVEETLEAAQQKAVRMRTEEAIRLRKKVKKLETMTIAIQKLPIA